MSETDAMSLRTPIDDGRVRGLHREAQKEYTRQRLLLAGSEVFRTTGFAEATIEEISDRAGLGRTTFYTHFKSKSSLATAIAIAATARNLECISELGNVDPLDLQALSGWLRDLQILTEQAAADAPLIELPDVSLEFTALMSDTADRIVASLRGNGWRARVEHPEQHVGHLISLAGRWVYRYHVQDSQIPAGSREALLSIVQHSLLVAFDKASTAAPDHA